MIQGAIDSPFTLARALKEPQIKPGHTLYLRGGTYTGDFVSTLVGVTIKAYAGERPIIDGSLTINGSDCTFSGLEVMYSGWTSRVSAFSGSVPTDIPLTKTLTINGPRTTMRRCVFHDLAGPGFWMTATDGLLEECLSYNNGWAAPDRGHGHSLYMQNFAGTKTVKRCVFGPGYSDFGFHVYSEGAELAGFDVQECVTLGKHNLFGGIKVIDRIAISSTVLWGGKLQLGYRDKQHGSAILTNNILANGATFVTVGTFNPLTEDGTDTTIGDRVLVCGGLVIVLNEAQAASVAAPIAGRYINCQNPAESVTLAQGSPLPLSGWTVAAPIAGEAPLTTWDSRFGVFLV
jgi:hypothetical protein